MFRIELNDDSLSLSRNRIGSLWLRPPRTHAACYRSPCPRDRWRYQNNSWFTQQSNETNKETNALSVNAMNSMQSMNAINAIHAISSPRRRREEIMQQQSPCCLPLPLPLAIICVVNYQLRRTVCGPPNAYRTIGGTHTGAHTRTSGSSVCRKHDTGFILLPAETPIYHDCEFTICHS